MTRIVFTCQTHGNVMRLLPPLVMPDALLGDGLAVLADAIHEVTDATTSLAGVTR